MVLFNQLMYVYDILVHYQLFQSHVTGRVMKSVSLRNGLSGVSVLMDVMGKGLEPGS